MISVTRLKTVSRGDLADINALLPQLSERLPPCSMKNLRIIVSHPFVELWVLRWNHRIVGMGSLALVTLPEGTKGRIEDVVIDSGYRGRGFGQKILEKLIARARARRVSSLELTSRAERVAANKLYVRMGFIQWDTDVYRFNI